MPIVNFYLKKTEGNDPRALIYLQFKYKGRKLVYSFGKKINPPDWSKTTKRVKSSRQTILDGRYAINDTLDKLEKHCLTIYEEERVRGTPPVDLMRFRLDAFLRQQEGGRQKESPLYRLFDRFISGEIKNKGKEKSRNTLKNYASVKAHLQQFDIASRFHIQFENIHLDFLRQYTDFLKKELGLKPNSIARDIGVLKTVMNEAVDSGYTANIQFRHKRFQFAGEDAAAVCLTEQDILTLYACDCSGNRRLQQVRDLFVLACLAGLPISGRKWQNTPLVQNNPPVQNAPLRHLMEFGQQRFISLPARAPGRSGTIDLPCHPIVRKILAGYCELGAELPRIPSNQKFNSYIKELARLAGLTEKGRLSGSPKMELWECISTATARRSLASHYHQQGFPVYELMGITGHVSEKVFLGFIGAVKRTPQT
jgi:Phage integrase SAM-like domain/Arm DNA-binding domain